MRLLTMAGGRAGQIEDYSFTAGQNALAAGFARPLELPDVATTTSDEVPRRPMVADVPGRPAGTPRGRKPQQKG